jgi:hypothetical protein
MSFIVKCCVTRHQFHVFQTFLPRLLRPKKGSSPTLTPVVGNLNSEKYINILDDNLWPVIAQHFPTSPYIFQEDNAPCHVSRRTNQWKTENDIPTLEWPPQSPDLNIIENVWKVIKTKIQLPQTVSIL